jgi:hypothetical protein
MMEQTNLQPVRFIHEERTSSQTMSYCVMQRSMVYGSMSFQRVSPWYESEEQARAFLNSFNGKGV